MPGKGETEVVPDVALRRRRRGGFVEAGWPGAVLEDPPPRLGRRRQWVARRKSDGRVVAGWVGTVAPNPASAVGGLPAADLEILEVPREVSDRYGGPGRALLAFAGGQVLRDRNGFVRGAQDRFAQAVASAIGSTDGLAVTEGGALRVLAAGRVANVATGAGFQNLVRIPIPADLLGVDRVVRIEWAARRTRGVSGATARLVYGSTTLLTHAAAASAVVRGFILLAGDGASNAQRAHSVLLDTPFLQGLSGTAAEDSTVALNLDIDLDLATDSDEWTADVRIAEPFA